MGMRDVGWVWEGQGTDPGVRPSIYGLGEGAAYFGLTRANFLFHPNDRYALQKLAHLDEVTCDTLRSYLALDRESPERELAGTPDGTRAEAEHVSGLSLEFPNITGGFFDDLKGVVQRRGWTMGQVAAARAALAKHNPALRMWGVVYSHELDDADFWAQASPYFDIANLWVWESRNLEHLDQYVARTRELFPDKPLIVGCYLRDYHERTPVPLDRLAFQLERVLDYLNRGLVAGYSILATVLIDGHRLQAECVRDFIAAH